QQRWVALPPNVPFLVLPPSVALRSLLFVNLVGGGVGAAALARELGLGTAAVLAGTLAFVLSGTTIGLTVWTPTIQGEYVWMPLVLFLCERLVRAGRLRDGLWLGLVLAMAWLPGTPSSHCCRSSWPACGCCGASATGPKDGTSGLRSPWSPWPCS